MEMPGHRASTGGNAMNEKTCAACDYKLEGETIKVKIGGQTVEVCCNECAQKLMEAQGAKA
jgi:ribosome-binding protein aMBF1 (putative translation factor)